MTAPAPPTTLAGPSRYQGPGARRDAERRALQRRLCAVIDSADPAEIAERERLLDRLNRPIAEAFLHRAPDPRDCMYRDGPLATVGARARSAYPELR